MRDMLYIMGQLPMARGLSVSCSMYEGRIDVFAQNKYCSDYDTGNPALQQSASLWTTIQLLFLLHS